jgi:predicted transcriptional regulator
MVAPKYAKARSELARAMGLGQESRWRKPEEVEQEASAQAASPRQGGSGQIGLRE